MWVDELVCYFVLLLLAAVAAFFFRGARAAPVGLSAALAFLTAACAVAVCGSAHLISDLPRLANSALALEKILSPGPHSIFATTARSVPSAMSAASGPTFCSTTFTVSSPAVAESSTVCPSSTLDSPTETASPG